MSGTVSEDRSGGIETELSVFQQDILAVLSEKARYGLAIERELEAYYGGNVNHGRLYPNLNELIEMALLRKANAISERMSTR